MHCAVAPQAIGVKVPKAVIWSILLFYCFISIHTTCTGYTTENSGVLSSLGYTPAGIKQVPLCAQLQADLSPQVYCVVQRLTL